MKTIKEQYREEYARHDRAIEQLTFSGKRLNVVIDGLPETLTLVDIPDRLKPFRFMTGSYNNNVYRYNTSGNRSQHSFSRPLEPGFKIKGNGCEYIIPRDQTSNALTYSIIKKTSVYELKISIGGQLKKYHFINRQSALNFIKGLV